METKLWAIMLVVFVTLLTSSAQVLYKFGAEKLNLNPLSLLTNYSLIGGLLLYGFGAVLLLIALKAGEVSVLYPIIATSYIWVALMAAYFFNETLSELRIFGIGLIFTGVIAVAIGSKKQNTKETGESQ